MENLFSQRNIGIVIAFLVIAGTGTYLVQQNLEKKEQEAKSALYKIQKTFMDENKAIPESDRDAGVTLDVDAKFSKTVSEMKGMLAAKTAPSRILYEAALKLGTLYLDHNQFEKAVQTLKETDSLASSHLQKASAKFLLGIALERAGQAKEARETFQSGLNENVDGLKGELLLGMVRMSLRLNEKDKAKLYSEKLSKDMQGSREAEMAQTLLKDNQG
jgi:TolA-binding protein